MLPHLRCKSGQQVLPQQPLHSPAHSTCELKGQMVASLQAWASQCGLQRCKAGAQVLCHLQSSHTVQSQAIPGCKINQFSYCSRWHIVNLDPQALHHRSMQIAKMPCQQHHKTGAHAAGHLLCGRLLSHPQRSGKQPKACSVHSGAQQQYQGCCVSPSAQSSVAM